MFAAKNVQMRLHAVLGQNRNTRVLSTAVICPDTLELLYTT